MQPPDLERWERTRTKLVEHNLAALVCRLPQHIVMLGGYWPVLGRSVVVFPTEGEPVLLAPVSEVPAIERGWIADVRTFRAWRVGDDDPEASLTTLSAQVFAERGLRGKRIGYEASFGDVATSQRVLEPWVGAHSVAVAFAGTSGSEEWVDFGPQLEELGGQKTEREMARVRIANEVADFGLEAFFREAIPGRSETEIAASVETAIHVHGVGYKGVGHARGQAQVISGPRTAEAWDYPVSSERVIEDGDLVVIELAVVADGYWADLTRTAVAGTPNDGQQRLFSAQRAAYEAAFAAMKPGTPAAAPDAAARRALDEFGLREQFCHHTGHGVGFRYHEPIPFVHPDSTGLLEAGMVTSLEPGLYDASFGGIRVEDNILITSRGAERLCHSPRWPTLEVS